MSGDVSFVIRAAVESVPALTDLLERVGRYGETDSWLILETPYVSRLGAQ
jgi:hypothetical protein